MEVQLEHGGLDELLGKVDVLANRVVFAVVTGRCCSARACSGPSNKGGPGVPLPRRARGQLPRVHAVRDHGPLPPRHDIPV